MDLWHGSLAHFVRAAEARALSAEMAAQFLKLHRYLPATAEVRSWEHSLAALGDAVRPLTRADLGVAIAASGTVDAGTLAADAQARALGVVLEYHLPLQEKRIDVTLTGHDGEGRATAVVLELKQWSRVELEDDVATNVLMNGEERLHPSEQARGYADWLTDYHSAFSAGELTAASAAYCHQLAPPADAPLRDARFGELLERSPLFVAGQERRLVEYLASLVGSGGGMHVLDRLSGARYRPSKRVMEHLEAVIEAREEWHLLDEQRVAYNAIFDEVRRQQSRSGRAAILVRGAPGTGKTVVAVQLLAACLRMGWKAAHSTGGKAFTTALRSRFRGADDLFVWNLSTRNAPFQGLDLLLVDEAHRVRSSSDMRFTPRIERGRKTQTRELLDAAKVCVFLLDEDQFVRPDEVGTSALFRAEASACGARLKEFDLATQFRCGGCTEYVAWVDRLLGFRDGRVEPFEDRYQLEIAESPADLDGLIASATAQGRSARIVAGFCWGWSDPLPTGELVSDVVVGAWSRPWNRKASDKPYKPIDHPYTRWATTEEGLGQVGVIYSAQGFEFDHVGVIWGSDLVWRTDRWVAQKAASKDKPVKASTEMLRLVRNAYRVLLTRGLLGTRALVLDPETREHVRSSLAAMGSGPL